MALAVIKADDFLRRVVKPGEIGIRSTGRPA